jgi:hypothetical protein
MLYSERLYRVDGPDGVQHIDLLGELPVIVNNMQFVMHAWHVTFLDGTQILVHARVSPFENLMDLVARRADATLLAQVVERALGYRDELLLNSPNVADFGVYHERRRLEAARGKERPSTSGSYDERIQEAKRRIEAANAAARREHNERISKTYGLKKPVAERWKDAQLPGRGAPPAPNPLGGSNKGDDDANKD